MTIYTANFGNYDNAYPGADVVYNESNDPFGGNKHITGKMRAKMYKVLNPELHDVWIDASVEILDREGFEELFSSSNRLTLIKHPFHSNLAQEIALCRSGGLIESPSEAILSDRCNPASESVYVGGVFAHMPNDVRISWWSEICTISDRDQLTLPLALCDASYNVLNIDIYNNPYFKIHSHR